MSNVVNRMLTEQMGGRHAETFIGKPGEIFYDPETGALRLGDGETPGGHSITESSPLESLFIGPWVYFARPDDQPEVMDEIAPNLILARSDGGSLYNAYEDSNGYELSTPYGTQWNTDGWDDFSNTKNRYYENLTSAWDGGGWATVKHHWIMHDTQNDKYYAIRFLTWDGGDNNATGAFSYIRREINTAIYFEREDTDTHQTALENGDEIASNLVITRGNGQAIFNYGLITDTRFTQFNTQDYNYSSYWEAETGIVYSEWNENDFLTAIQQLKVGDTVRIENGDGYTETTVETAFNIVTGTFTTAAKPETSHSPSYIVMDLTKPFIVEDSYNDNQSPFGTLWNAEGYDDLSNLKSRQWMVFHDIFNGVQLGKRITGKELVMWDTLNDKYYAIKFTRWQQGNAGFGYPGFAYTRRLIDVEKLTSGIKFSDGTIQQTAYSEKNAGTLKQSPKLLSTITNRYITPADIGKVIYLYGGTSTTNLIIPDGGTADFPVGATITIINRTGGNIYLEKDNDDENGTIYGAGTAISSRYWTIPDAGGGNICTLMKIETGMDNFFNDWMLSGSNIQDNS